jgi:hypothetical protein
VPVAPSTDVASAAAIVASTVSAHSGPNAPSTVVGIVAPTLGSGAVASGPAVGPSAPVAGAASGFAPGQTTLIGPAMPAPLQPQALSPDRSPWAPPSTLGPQGAFAMEPEGRSDVPVEGPVVAPPVIAPPVVAPPVLPGGMSVPVLPEPIPAQVIAPPMIHAAPPVVPAPLLAAPILAPGAGGGKKSNKADKDDGKSKGKFRETMWFKKGELDAQAAEAAAQEHAKTGKDASDKSDLMPIDERYKDDGTLSRSDKEKYSLRTGVTTMNPVVRDPGAHNSMGKVSENALIDEMKGGRNKIFALIAVGLVVLVVIILMLVR